MRPYYQDDFVTLYHGDCLTEHREWLTADVLVTDPPYGMAYRSGRTGSAPILGDQSMTVRDDALDAWGDKPALVFGTWKQPRPERSRQLIVWDKRGGAGFSGDLKMPWATITEEIYVLGRGWTGRRVPAIYSVPTLHSRHPERYGHPTPKPVPLMEQLLEKCPPGVITDPFAGSGATLAAAKNVGRRVIGVELEERWCEVIATRCSQIDPGSVELPAAA
jgi:site-specific DNA-methyltransferase (adenine-specific)